MSTNFNNSNNKPSSTDARHGEFRKYLEQQGVLDAITKVLNLLYAETNRPDDALGYVRQHFARMMEPVVLPDTEALIKQVEDLTLKNAELQQKIDKQKTQEEM